MGVYYRVKQYGRDRAAKADSWAITKKVFDAEKSSDKKYEKRVKDTDVIFQMIAKLPDYNAQDPKIVISYKRVENYIAATGCELKALYRLNGKIDEQRELLMESMKKR